LTPFSLTVEHWRLFGMSQAQLVPLDTIRSMLAHGVVDSEFRQLAGNIVLFVPFGLALPLAVPRCRRVARTVAVGVLLSLAFELVQHVAPYHGFDIDDILLNGLGTAIGYLVYASLARIARRAIHEHE
jgi:glycopeptide antibiotics resistance protein